MLKFSNDFLEEIRQLQLVDEQVFLDSFSQTKSRYIRLNPAKMNNKVLQQLIQEYDLVPTQLNSDVYQVNKLTIPLGQNPYYHAGCYYPQDVAASMVVKMMNVQSTDLVCDLCAAPGGKTTQLCEMADYVIANEVNRERVKVLKQNVARLGFDNIKIHNLEVSKLSQDYLGVFDKVLVDAPCSSESLIYLYPDMAKQVSKNEMLKYQQIQINLLLNAFDLVKDGGLVTYSTCTFNTIENEAVVLAVLKQRADVELVSLPQLDQSFRGVTEIGDKVVRFYPHVIGEGHFVAQFKVNNKLNHHLKIKPNSKFDTKPLFLGDWVNMNVTVDKDKLFVSNHYFYDGKLPIYSTGSQAYDYNGKRWVVNHDLSMNINFQSQPITRWTADKKAAYQYLNGQELFVNESLKNGFICYNNCVLGFFKGNGLSLKNYYPKGLRNRFDKEKGE